MVFHGQRKTISEVFADENQLAFVLFLELVESIMYLYKATKDPHLLVMGMQILDSIEKNAKTECGYATVSLHCFSC